MNVEILAMKKARPLHMQMILPNRIVIYTYEDFLRLDLSVCYFENPDMPMENLEDFEKREGIILVKDDLLKTKIHLQIVDREFVYHLKHKYRNAVLNLVYYSYQLEMQDIKKVDEGL